MSSHYVENPKMFTEISKEKHRLNLALRKENIGVEFEDEATNELIEHGYGCFDSTEETRGAWAFGVACGLAEARRRLA